MSEAKQQKPFNPENQSSAPATEAKPAGHEQQEQKQRLLDLKRQQREEELFQAARYGRTEIVRILLQQGVNPNAQDKFGKTALHMISDHIGSCIGKGDMANIQCLLAHGADPTLRDKNGRTSYGWGEIRNYIERLEREQPQRERDLAVVRSILADQDGGPDNLPVFTAEVKGAGGRSILGDVMDFLGGDIAVSIPAENKPPAAPPAMEAPPAADAKAEAKDKEQKHRLPDRSNHQSVAPSVTIPLHEAVLDGDVMAVRRLLDAKADVNAQNALGSTALHIAATGEPEILLLLLQHGAKIDALDKQDNSALHVAAGIGDKACVQHLLDHDANCSLENDAGQTAARCAEDAEIRSNIDRFAVAQWKQRDLDRERKLERQEREAELCREALREAASNGKTDYVRSLLDKEVYIDARDNTFGRTALFWAVQAGHTDIVKLLLQRGADVNTRDKDGWTPLHRATQNGDEACVKLLLAHGANRELPNKWGRTATSYSAAALVASARTKSGMSKEKKEGKIPHRSNASKPPKRDNQSLLKCVIS